MPARWAVAIWDVDGTLVDTAELHYAAWVELARRIDKPFHAGRLRRHLRAVQPRDHPLAVRRTGHGRTGRRHRRCKEMIYRDAALVQGVTLLPGVARLLEAFRERGWRQAVEPSAPRANLELILAATGTRDFFDAVVAMEDTAPAANRTRKCS